MATHEASKREDRARGRAFVRSLTRSELFALGDAFVLGDFDWREWLPSKPSAAFLAAADDERMLLEDCGE